MGAFGKLAMRTAWIFGLAAAMAAAPGHANGVTVHAPAGRAGSVAVVIARQTGSSIIVADPAIARRRVRAIRGEMSELAAVQLLARYVGAQAIRVGANGWRLVAAPRRSPLRPRAAPRPSTPLSQLPASEGTPIEILVIGSKRGTSLSEFAGQVEMIAGEDLTFGGVGGTEKIIQRLPTVASTYLGSGRNKLFIRGIADSSFTGPTQSTVGQYLGDLRLTYNAPDPDLRLSDLQRVEVLEGPQGTLYGAGSLGGIVRLVPNDPELGRSFVSAMAGGTATQHGEPGADASVTANLPLLGEGSALRFTLNAERQGGYIDKPLLGEADVNRTQIYSGRAAARFEVGNDWTIDLLGVGQQTEGRDSQYADRDGPPLSRQAMVTEGFDADFAQAQVIVTGRIGDVRIKSSTGVTGQRVEERYDATLEGGAPRLFVQRNDTEMIANETRLWQPLDDRFGWLVGGALTDNRTRLRHTLGAPDSQGAITGVTNEITEVTAYGEASLRLTDGLVANAGARYTHSRLGGQGEDVSPTIALARAAVTASRTEQAFLPSASVVGSVAPATTLFLRYQEGFRPGGLAIAGDFVSRFDGDRIATFEIGGRHGRPGAGPFDLAASVAFSRWQNIQADFIARAGLPSTANIGNGRIWAATVTAGLAVTPELRLDAGFTYNDGRIDEPSALLLARVAPALGIPNFSGRIEDLPVKPLEQITEIPNVARFSGRIGFDYDKPLRGGLSLTAQGWATYVGRSRLGVGPELGKLQGDYLDTGITVRIGRQNFGATVGLTNLTDEVGNRFALGTPFAVGRDQITPLRPRSIRIGLDASF